MSGEHWLIVGPFDPDDDTDRFDIEHPDDCPREDLGAPPSVGPAWFHTCAVAYYLDEGIDFWFRHADDLEPAYPDEAQPVSEGRHEIESWSHRSAAGPRGGGEYYGGIRLAGAAATT